MQGPCLWPAWPGEVALCQFFALCVLMPTSSPACRTLQVAPKVNGSNNMMTGTLMAVQDLSKAPPELRQLWQSSSVSLALHRAQGGVLRASPERVPTCCLAEHTWFLRMVVEWQPGMLTAVQTSLSGSA